MLSYILGLLDCIGELKRRVFDEMRVGNIEEAPTPTEAKIIQLVALSRR